MKKYFKTQFWSQIVIYMYVEKILKDEIHYFYWSVIEDFYYSEKPLFSVKVSELMLIG